MKDKESVVDSSTFLAAKRFWLNDEEKPTYWFVKSQKLSTGKMSLHMLPNQFVPVDVKESNTYYCEAQIEPFNVTCKDEGKRTAYSEGSVFAVSEITVQALFYRVEDNTLYCVTSFDETTTEEIREAWDEYADKYGEDGKKGSTIVVEKITPDKPKPRQETFLEKLHKDKELLPPTVEDDGFYVDKDLWYFLVRAAKKRDNCLLIGPTGTGKTVLCSLLAKKLGSAYEEFSMSAMNDPIAGLLGVHRLKIDEETGNNISVFDRARFSYCIRSRVPTLICLDELSRMKPGASNILFPVLDDRRFLPMEMASSDVDRQVSVSKKISFFATANIGNEYSGTELLDRAMYDRWGAVADLNYMPKKVEANLLKKLWGISHTQAGKIVGIADQIRLLFLKGELSTTVSTRLTKKTAELIADGYSEIQAYKHTFLSPGLFEGTEKEGEKSTVKAIISSK
jgi:MoxR-like ATPase